MEEKIWADRSSAQFLEFPCRGGQACPPALAILHRARIDVVGATIGRPCFCAHILFFLRKEKEKNGFKKTPPVCAERRQPPLCRGGLWFAVLLDVYVVVDMVDAIAVVAIAL